MKTKFIIIKTTYPKLQEAKKIAKILLTKKLAACINFSKINSEFIWQNKINKNTEILLSIKSKTNNYKEIEKEIIKNHPYNTPQIIAIPIILGNKNYLNWLNESC